MIHTPVNLRGRVLDYLKNNLPELEKNIGDKVTLYTPHDPEYTSDCSEEWLAPSIEKGIVPDVMLTHASEFASLNNRKESGLFSDLAEQCVKENPVREELSLLTDPNGLFYPLFVVPLAMSYNTRKINENELKHSWADLFNEKFKVIFPERGKPLSIAVGAYLMHEFPEQFPAFEQRVVYEGTPANVVKSVVLGEYNMAVTNVTFSIMVEGRNTAINFPKEGFVLLPQVLVWKKGADEKLKIIADLLMREEMQNYFSEQGAWPGLRSIPIGETIAYDGRLKNWQGWDAYCREVSEFDKYTSTTQGGT
jgi:ABC-type Fe3+ transport system substrate-binding protein